jgi:beta-galactosidase
VGQIAQAMTKYRDEIWQLRREPTVGVLWDWDNDAGWAAMSVSNRDSFKMAPVKARVGISRALINANVPYEYVTPRDLRMGLAARYKVIYLPAMLTLNSELVPILTDYVKQGGRLVIDMPSAWYDQYYKLFETKPGTAFESLFGAVINEYQYAGINRPYKIGDFQLNGFTISLKPTKAQVLAKYDDGLPAITENKLGKGTAVILGYEGSTMCYQPNHTQAEAFVIKQLLGTVKGSPYQCDGAITYRLAGPQADHYFLINDGPATTTRLTTTTTYKKAIDVVTGETIALDQPIHLDRYNGRWLRLEK